MDRWRNKVAVVTGASSGIGAAIVVDLIQNGMIVVGLARRVERVAQLRDQLAEEFKSNLHPLQCDVTDDETVLKCFKWIEDHLGGTDILVNNAGKLHMDYLSTMDSNLVKEVLDTNVMAIVYCTREAFKSMKARNVDGHVILINSIAGHKVLTLNKEGPSFNIYPATKFAVTAMTEVYRQEFSNLNTKVKITSVSPGLVRTEMTSDQIGLHANCLEAKDVSDAVLYCIGTPPHVQIHEITVKVVGEQF